MKNIKAWVSTPFVGSRTEIEVEVPQDEWDEKSPQEQDEYVMNELLLSGVLSWDYEDA